MTVPLQEARNSLLERATAYVRSRIHGAQAAAAEKLRADATGSGSRPRTSSAVTPSTSPAPPSPTSIWASAARRAPPGSGCTPRRSTTTAGRRPTRWSRSSSTTCPSWSTRSRMELVRQGCGLHLVVHPVVDGVSFIHVEIDRQPAASARRPRARPARRPRRRAGGGGGLAGHAGRRRSPWRPNCRNARPRATPTNVTEARRLPPLAGRRPLHVPRVPRVRPVHDGDGGDDTLKPVPGSGLGILRDDPAAPVPPRPAASPACRPSCAAVARDGTAHPDQGEHPGHRPPPDAARLRRRQALRRRRRVGRRAPVPRPLHLDDAQGAHAEIPVLRRKVAAVLERAGFAPASPRRQGAGRGPRGATPPRAARGHPDELFDTAMGILDLQERQRVRLFVRRDRFGRFWSLPRLRAPRPLHTARPPADHRHPDGRLRRHRVRVLGPGGGVGAGPAALHRPHRPGTDDAPDLDVVEARIAQAARSWADDLREALLESHGEERGLDLLRRYGDAFPAAYRADFPARAAVADIDRIESLDRRPTSSLQPRPAAGGRTGCCGSSCSRPRGRSRCRTCCRCSRTWACGSLDQRPYEVRPRRHRRLDLRLRPPAAERSNADLETDGVQGIFTEAFAAVWRGEAENDGFNRLVLGAGLTAREVVVLRAYASTCARSAPRSPELHGADAGRQPRHRPPAGRAVPRPLRPRPPARRRATRPASLTKQLEAAHRRGGQPRRGPHPALVPRPGPGHAADQLVPARASRATRWCSSSTPTQVPDLPLPRPRYEIFVYSPRVEGVHLRGGRVSRGGIRWSDRREDFRTEVLGLMKAQMVKNAVIVPVGAKGGFVVKRPPGRR